MAVAGSNYLLIFDVDGVLRDSSIALDESNRRVFAALNKEYCFRVEDTWHMRGLGRYNRSVQCLKALLALTKSKQDLGQILAHRDAEKRLDEICEEQLTDQDLKDLERTHWIYHKFFDSVEAKPLIKTYPYVKDVLDLLKKNGCTLSIFSNSSKAAMDRDLPGIGLEKFSLMLSGEDVKNQKPSGEGITKIMEQLNYNPSKTYYVGDAVIDVLAARDAGCKAISVLSGMGLRMHLEAAKPDLIFDDLKAVSDYFTIEDTARE